METYTDHHVTRTIIISDITPILSALNTRKSEVILAGEYNIDLLKIASKPVFYELLDTVNFFWFYPQITLPTRLAERSGSLIDNFFCKLSHVKHVTS